MAVVELLCGTMADGGMSDHEGTDQSRPGLEAALRLLVVVWLKTGWLDNLWF